MCFITILLAERQGIRAASPPCSVWEARAVLARGRVARKKCQKSASSRRNQPLAVVLTIAKDCGHFAAARHSRRALRAAQAPQVRKDQVEPAFHGLHSTQLQTDFVCAKRSCCTLGLRKSAVSLSGLMPCRRPDTFGDVLPESTCT